MTLVVKNADLQAFANAVTAFSAEAKGAEGQLT
jgi:hypothetical protein